MIRIRTITYNASASAPADDELRRIMHCAAKWDRACEPHTQRVNLAESHDPVSLREVRRILRICDISPIRWVNVPLNPVSGNVNKLCRNALDVLSLSSRTFVNLIGVDGGTIINGAFDGYAGLTRAVAALDRSGKNNFRLGLSYNIGHDCPFFPFTRSKGDELTFSVGFEMVQDINEALRKTRKEDLAGKRDEILAVVKPQIDRYAEIAYQMEKETGVRFRGFDFSLAPVIGDSGSIVTILNSLGVFNFGHTGTMFMTSYLTDILKGLAQTYPSVGFSGVMYSLLEDLDLCAINNKRGVTLEQMTALSTMCGCGLDMIPVSGDITDDEIYSCCLDIAGISCREKKPLGVRLLPIPGTRRNQKAWTSISEDADFIANTRVVPLDANLLPQMGDKFEYLVY